VACYQSGFWSGCYGISGYKFGQPDPDYGVNGVHPGTDFGLPSGTTLTTPRAGTVTYAGWDKYLGNTIKLTLDNGDKIVLGHLSSLSVGPGPVSAGQTLGQSGQSGNATGPHLHFEAYPNGGNAVDPVAYLTGASGSGGTNVAGINLDVGGAITAATKSITSGATTLSLYVAFFLLGVVILVFALRSMTTQPAQTEAY
jgi:hypothetical protein